MHKDKHIKNKHHNPKYASYKLNGNIANLFNEAHSAIEEGNLDQGDNIIKKITSHFQKTHNTYYKEFLLRKVNELKTFMAVVEENYNLTELSMQIVYQK